MADNDHFPVGTVIADYKRQVAELESQVKMLRGSAGVHAIQMDLLRNELALTREELGKLQKLHNWLDDDASDWRAQTYLISCYNQALDDLGKAGKRIEELEQVQGQNNDLKTALHLVMDEVDYTSGNCKINEAVGAVLQKEIISLAKLALNPVRAGARVEG